MLFILIMDVLCYLVKKLLKKNSCGPCPGELYSTTFPFMQMMLSFSSSLLSMTSDSLWIFLQLFGEASGLKTKVQKSTVLPIHCTAEHLTTLQTHLPCHISEFPCTYLGVPLWPYKLTKTQVQSIIEKIADRLPGWKTDLLTKAGRSILVQFVLTSMVIYLLLAQDLPTKALEAIDKIRRGFIWKGRKDVKGGHCLIAWTKVTRPPDLGGLGISHLQFLG